MTSIDASGAIARDPLAREYAGYRPRRAARPRPRPGFQAVLDQVEVDHAEEVTLRTLPLRERRRLALERLEVAAKPRRRFAEDEQHEALGLWERRRGPAPIGFYAIVVVVALFVVLGLVMVLSASAQVQVGRGASPYAIFNRQLVWAGIGAGGLFVAMHLNLVLLRRLAVAGLAVASLSMLMPFAPGFGTTINGARSWVAFAGLSVQPSEFLKLAVVVFAADLLVRRQHELTDVKRGLRPLGVLAVVAAGGCLVQGDLGSAIVMTAIVGAVAFIGGVPLSPIIAATAAAVGAAIVFVVSSPFRRDRFTAFLDLAGHKGDEAYQVWQSMLAMASGGLTGSGVGGGNGKLGYLPLAHSDFIFAVVADELGFVGTLAVVGGFGILTWFGIQAALSSPDRFGMLLAGGVTAWFGVQAVVNMGGVTGLMPVTGLTLPFFSAGGSSLFVSMTAAGLLLNVARRGRLSTRDDR